MRFDDLPYPGMITWPRVPAVALVETPSRQVPCCQTHMNGKIKWCNAMGLKPRVMAAHYGAACEGCKAIAYQDDLEVTALRECIKEMRAVAQPVGPLHGWWDVIFDAEACLDGKPMAVELSRWEILSYCMALLDNYYEENVQ